LQEEVSEVASEIRLERVLIVSSREEERCRYGYKEIKEKKSVSKCNIVEYTLFLSVASV
jgi:hypothetical protein